MHGFDCIEFELFVHALRTLRAQDLSLFTYPMRLYRRRGGKGFVGGGGAAPDLIISRA